MPRRKPDPAREEPARLNPAALSPADVARLLAKAGGKKVAAADVEADVAAGAPVNRDGTIHLVHYAGWLAGRVR